MARKPDPKSKAGFVRSFPSVTPAAEIVTKAKAKGIKIDVRYVYSVRTAVRAKRKKTRTAAAPVMKRGPARLPKSAVAASSANGSSSRDADSSGGLEQAIEAIVERKVTELLKARLGALFG